MKPTLPTTRAVRWVRTGLGCCFVFVISLTAAFSQQLQDLKKDEKKEMAMPKPNAPSAITKLPVEAGAVEVSFTDGSNLKLLLRDEKIELATPYGKLIIPVADIQRIEFATRLSEEDAKHIHTAIVALGSSEFNKREAASAQLLKLREKAFPALVRAAENEDLEVLRRAKELIEQIANSVPHDLLIVRPKDVVYTADSMIAGRIEGGSFKAHTSQFGAVQLKLADARSLRSLALDSETNLLRQPPMGRPGMPTGAKEPGGPPPGMQPGGFPGINPKGGMMPMQAK
jgi:hypothetical protein